MTPFWFVVVVANIVGAQCFSHILTSDLSLFFSPFLVLDICIATTGIELLHPNSPQCILEKKMFWLLWVILRRVRVWRVGH